MKTEILIGCSAFNNAYWKGIFYPEDLPASKRWEFYCQHFNTYEMNGTFYKFPTVKTMENWYNKTSENFLFSVKVPKEITHIKKLMDCEERLAEFYGTCKNGLKDKLGYLLFQLPPSYRYEPERLTAIVKLLHPDFLNVIEFRHESWWIPEVQKTLSEAGITMCSVSYPNLPNTVFTNGPLVYVRLHGVPKLFYSEYTTEEILQLKEAITNSDKPKQIVVYFNNTASDAGIKNALELKNSIR